ncbi:hypothetical protein Ancab_028900 [Ancistrocladus abbreviatus]
MCHVNISDHAVLPGTWAPSKSFQATALVSSSFSTETSPENCAYPQHLMGTSRGIDLIVSFSRTLLLGNCGGWKWVKMGGMDLLDHASSDHHDDGDVEILEDGHGSFKKRREGVARRESTGTLVWGQRREVRSSCGKYWNSHSAVASVVGGCATERTEPFSAWGVKSESENITFSKKVKQNRYYMTFPKAVVAEKELRKKKNMVLRDPKGNLWQVRIAQRLDGRVDIAKGWKDFLSGNAIEVGDTLSFEFLSDNLMQIHMQRGFIT